MAFFDDGKLTGDMLAFYIDGKALACEISCEFTINQDIKQISPYMAGGWQQILPGVRNWQMTASANFISHFREADFKTILSAYMNQTPMQIAMRTSLDYAPAFFVGGQAYPTSSVLSSSGNDIVSYTTTFIGDGPVTYTSEASEGDFWRILNANPANADKPFIFKSSL